MKRLTLSLLLLFSLGTRAQDIALWTASRPMATFPGSAMDPLPFPTPAQLDTPTLLARADLDFSQGGYARAARGYDRVLGRSDAVHSTLLLSRAGDAHYYSGNLIAAHRRYGELSRRQGRSPVGDQGIGLGDRARQGRALRLAKLFQASAMAPMANDSLSPGEGVPRVKIRNLEFNSRYSDFAPMFHRGTQLVFASSRDTGFLKRRRDSKGNQAFLDLYVADTQGDGNLAPKKFSHVLNTKYHEASVAFSKDERTIYFTRNNFGKKLKRNAKKDIAHLKIFRSVLIDGEWAPAEELPINGEDFSTGHPTLSADGTKMYFVSDRPGGYGGTDIYVVDLLPNGGFSEPKNLGRTVNTPAKEMFPYSTENALYFSSDRAMGLGGLDLYRADHENGLFSVAVNLGEPFNSERDDFSLIIDASGERGYFASNRKGGKGDDDLYAFALVPNLNTLTGIVADALTQQPLDQVRVALLDRAGKPLGESLTQADGRYGFRNLAPMTPYTIMASKEGYGQAQVLATTQQHATVEIDPILQRPLDRVVVGQGQIVLDPEAVHFDFDRHDITARAALELDKLAALLHENPSLVISIEAHTDAVGDRGYNLRLSEKRAQATLEYLLAQGVGASQIQSAKGYGEERPLNACSDGRRCSKEQHRANRRSEFHIVAQ